MPKAARKLGDVLSDRSLVSPEPAALDSNSSEPTPPEAQQPPAKTRSTRGVGQGKGGGRPPMRKRLEADLQRKELTLTTVQIDQLTILARRLNRQRDKAALGAEPITESALVRCALHVLLESAGGLGGNNEQEVMARYIQILEKT